MNEKKRILIVDDESCVRELLVHFLNNKGYDCIQAENAQCALNILHQKNIPIIISDIRMPGLDGIGFLQEVKQKEPFTEVIMATALTETSTAVEAMRQGAYDYVVKPFDLKTVETSVRRAFERRQLLIENKEYHDRLEEKVQEKTSELVEKNTQLRLLFLNTIQSLVQTLEAKDKYTEGHSRRVAEMSSLMAKRLRFSDEDVEKLRLAGILHDIGKIGVREACLNKPGTLTEAESEEIKQHPLISERILTPIEELQEILADIRHHHERYDGNGYPHGLRGVDIPLGARILAVADSYDAMTSDRPYRPALTADKALDELEVNAGKQFDPQLIKVFIELYDGSPGAKNGPGVKEVFESIPFSQQSLCL
ncbi:MAG: response regulator [Gemmatimonadota bacterium]|nr:MAG: response regulator [Gemmatimonadota bacterium]